MDKRRFAHFSGMELYMLKRQAMESSVNIVLMGDGRYSNEQQRVHENLMNEIITECIQRDIEGASSNG